MRKLYTVRDVLQGFGVINGIPAVLDIPNDEVAIRVLKGSMAAGAQPNAFNVNAEDKEMWCLGEFDERTGRITACDPYLVARAIDYKEISNNEVNQSSGDAKAN